MSMTNEQYRAMRTEFQKRALRSEVWCSCLNCDEWREVTLVEGGAASKQTLCCKYKALPPPEVLVHGCPEWVPLIPF